MNEHSKTKIGNKSNCLKCGEFKTIANREGWCDKCYRLDLMGYETEDDIPWRNCQCKPGCPKLVRAFTYRGKENKYYPGHHVMGARNPRYRNGLYTDKDGYEYMNSPTHPFKNSRGYVLKSHRIYEIYTTLLTGKVFYIPRGYEIHHKNWRVQDNRIENMQLLSKKDHASLKDGQRYEAKIPPDRPCQLCGILNEEYRKDDNTKVWYKYEKGFICRVCYERIKRENIRR